MVSSDLYLIFSVTSKKFNYKPKLLGFHRSLDTWHFFIKLGLLLCLSERMLQISSFAFIFFGNPNNLLIKNEQTKKKKHNKTLSSLLENSEGKCFMLEAGALLPSLTYEHYAPQQPVSCSTPQEHISSVSQGKRKIFRFLIYCWEMMA